LQTGLRVSKNWRETFRFARTEITRNGLNIYTDLLQVSLRVHAVNLHNIPAEPLTALRCAPTPCWHTQLCAPDPCTTHK